MSTLLDIRPYDRLLWLGDSKTQGDNYGTSAPSPGLAPLPKWQWYLQQRINAKFAAARKTPPIHVTSGNAGDTVGNIVAGLLNRCYQWNPTGVIVEVTTNDVTDVIPNATYTSDLNSLLGGITTAANYSTGSAPRWVLFVGPNMIGENWPNGANAFDTVPTGIDAKAAIYLARAAAFGVVAWNPRAAVLAWQAANNPTHRGSGLLTSALDGPTLGKHEIDLGAQAMSGWLMDNVFMGIPASLPQFPVFTFVTA